jgi:hypothetical protein
MDELTLNFIATAAPAIVSIVMGAVMFGVIRYVPSRKEFEMHTKQDDERHKDMKDAIAEVKAAIQSAKTDIIREVKNGKVNDAYSREHA